MQRVFRVILWVWVLTVFFCGHGKECRFFQNLSVASEDVAVENTSLLTGETDSESTSKNSTPDNTPCWMESSTQPKMPTSRRFTDEPDHFELKKEFDGFKGRNGIAYATYTNSIGMKFRHIIPLGANGGALLGQPPQCVIRYSNDFEGVRQVKFSSSFYIGIYEVTYGDFSRFVEETGYKTQIEKGAAQGLRISKYVDQEIYPSFLWTKRWDYTLYGNPRSGKGLDFSWKSPGFEQTDQTPVVNVTWQDAQEFCKWLSKKEGLKYRLPTEAEWEYAARADTFDIWMGGDNFQDTKPYGNYIDTSYLERQPQSIRDTYDRAYIYSNSPYVGDDAPYAYDDGYAYVAPVGSFQPNAFGLYDMTGNVWEYCLDYYSESYDDLPSLNPVRVKPYRPLWDQFKYCHAVRGGAYDSPLYDTMLHVAVPIFLGEGRCNVGFRVVIMMTERPSADSIHREEHRVLRERELEISPEELGFVPNIQQP